MRAAIERDILDAAPEIARAVSEHFRDMFRAVDKSNLNALAAMRITPKVSPRIAQLLQRKMVENVDLIKDAIGDLKDSVFALIEKPENLGLRVEDLAAQIKERTSGGESRAALIARDQTLKANGDLVRERQLSAGITRYVWSTSQDERVRDTHAELEGETFDWDNPPEPGHPGQDYQCRCVAIPVVSEFEGLNI
jgi:SPP1 gp7 family putative phage head morphogenesis protein